MSAIATAAGAINRARSCPCSAACQTWRVRPPSPDPTAPRSRPRGAEQPRFPGGGLAMERRDGVLLLQGHVDLVETFEQLPIPESRNGERERATPGRAQ